MRTKLIEWEKSHGYKARFVANKIGVSDATWSKIKAGTQQPTLGQIEKLRTEFQLDNILDLLKEDTNEELRQSIGNIEEDCIGNV